MREKVKMGRQKEEVREGTGKEKIRDGKNRGKKAEPVRKKEAQKDKGKTS